MNKEKLLLVVDIETTGLSFLEEGVTEITAKAYDEKGNLLYNVYNDLTNPEKTIPDFLVELTGITNEMVSDKISYRKAFYYLSNWIDEYSMKYDIYLVAHNADFEKKFFAWNLTQRSFMKLNIICTRANHLMIKDGNFDGKQIRNNSKLKIVAEYYGMIYDEEKAHRAEYDVDLCKDVLMKQLEKLSIEEMCKTYKQFIGVK